MGFYFGACGLLTYAVALPLAISSKASGVWLTLRNPVLVDPRF